MHPGTAIFIASACIAAIFALGYRLKHSIQKYVKLPNWLLWAAVIFLIFGAALIVFFSNRLEAVYAQKSWPVADGRVTASFVVGERAFRPDIEFRYIVNGDTLDGSSSLQQPGFGGRINRLDAAEKLVQKYGVGKTITVHYQPGNPQHSTLSPGPTYAVFLKLGNAALLFIIGLALVLIRLFQPKMNTSV